MTYFVDSPMVNFALTKSELIKYELIKFDFGYLKCPYLHGTIIP